MTLCPRRFSTIARPDCHDLHLRDAALAEQYEGREINHTIFSSSNIRIPEGISSQTRVTVFFKHLFHKITMTYSHEGNKEKQAQQSSKGHHADPATPENENDSLFPTRLHQLYSDPPISPRIDIPEVVEPPVPAASPEPSLFGYGYPYLSAVPPHNKTSNYEFYKGQPYPKAGDKKSDNYAQISPPPASPSSTGVNPSRRTDVPKATLSSDLDVSAFVTKLEAAASRAEESHNLENQRRTWHVAALGIGVRKVGDEFGFSSAGASRCITPVGWPQGGITGRKP
jgi:hypothetical protein